MFISVYVRYIIGILQNNIKKTRAISCRYEKRLTKPQFRRFILRKVQQFQPLQPPESIYISLFPQFSENYRFKEMCGIHNICCYFWAIRWNCIFFKDLLLLNNLCWEGTSKRLYVAILLIPNWNKKLAKDFFQKKSFCFLFKLTIRYTTNIFLAILNIFIIFHFLLNNLNEGFIIGVINSIGLPVKMWSVVLVIQLFISTKVGL